MSNDVAINNAGSVVFQGFASTGFQGFWLADETLSPPELLLRSGDPAPGATPSAFNGFTEPVINGSGQIAFAARAGVNWGVWSGAPEAAELVALSGDEAPGAVAGEEFCFFPPRIALNAEGDVAFLAGTCDPGTKFPVVGAGLWAWTTEDGLIPVAIAGRSLEIPDAAGKTVSIVRTAFGNLNRSGVGGSSPSSGNEDGQPSALSDAGELVFAVEFDDGSAGVFLATLRATDPVALLNSLIDAVEQAGLANGATRPLLDKLAGALSRITDGVAANDGAAVSLLGDFINILAAKAGKTVPEDLAETWTEEATRIIELLTASDV